MPQFPRSQRTVNASQTPLPFSTGGGYAAPGAALQQLGKQISSFAGKLQAEQEKADEFAFKTGLQKFANEQEQKYTSYRDTIDGDAGNFPTDVLRGFDKDWSKFQEGIPPQLRQKAELYKERFRGDYQRRSYGDQQRIRSRWYVAQGTDLFAKTILPRVTGDIRSVESGLTATENIIGSMSGVPPQVANKLREQAAQQIFKKWLQAAGPDAAPAAREIIERYKATRIGPTPGSARAAQEGERAPQTAPVPAGGMPDYRGQRGPAPIRYNNPSGQYPGPSARKFGAVGTEIIGGGHKIAVFPTAVHGGAAHFDLLSRAYAGKSIAALVRKWGGGNSPTAYANNVSRQLGVSPGTVVTRQMLQDPSFAIPFAKAMARHETGREYPMSDDQWRQAHAMAFGGAAPTPAAQPITTQDHFHRLIIENAEKIERGETLAQRRSEVDARRKERAIHDATTREGYEMLFDKKLTREWVEANKDNLPTGTYVTFMKAVVPQGRTTDPQVFSHLLERADERPKDIMEEAAQAYARGDLNYDSYRVIASKARKALDPNGQSSAPPWVREQRSIIKQQLRPGRGASQAQYEAYGKALEAYDNYVDRQGAEIDRKALREWSSGLVEQTKKGLVSANKTALPMPRFSQVGRTAMTVEEIDATVERTVRAYRAGKLSKDEFIAEAKALKQWRGVLEDQAGTEGKTIAPPQPKAEGAGRFAAPGLGARSEVKGTSETVPDQVTQEITPEVFGQIAEVLGIDPDEISTADILERMQQLPPDHPVWTWIPPALTGRQAEGTGLLPFGRYEMPDGSQKVSFGLPQGLLDAWRSVRYGLGYEQDPNAPEGYVSFDAMNKGAFGAAGGAITGALGAGAARAIRSGMPRNVVSSGGAPEPPMKPITAYHGSPHDFDRFDLTKIGTGEGAQAFGHGLYFAENPGVADSYRSALSARGIADADGTVRHNEIFRFKTPETSDAILAEYGDQAWSIINSVLRQNDGDVTAAGKMLDEFPQRDAVVAAKRALQKYAGDIEPVKAGRLYKVEINARPEQFLDWDKPLFQQPPKVQEILQQLGIDTAPKGQWSVKPSKNGDKWTVYNVWGEASGTFKNKADAEAKAATGTQRHNTGSAQLAYMNLGGNAIYSNLDKGTASKALREAGIPGIRYLDQGSRGNGQGTYNYVIFDDSLVKIAEKYGFIVPGPNGMPAVSEENLKKVQEIAKKQQDQAPQE